MQDTYVALLVAFISSATTLLAIWLRNYLEKRSTKIGNPFAYNEKYRKITEILEEIRVEIGATRVSLFEFHNGGKLYSGQSEQKMSMKAETIEEHRPHLLKDYQGLSVAIFDRNLRHLEKNPYYIEHNEQQYNDTLTILNRIAGINMTATFRIDSGYVSNNVNLPLGVVVVSFAYPVVLAPSQIQYIQERMPIIHSAITKVV